MPATTIQQYLYPPEDPPETELTPERIDRIIWRGLGHKSVRQLAHETGLTPEQVYSRKQELFEAVDVLSLQEQQMKAMVSMQELAENAREMAENIMDERNVAGAYNAAVNAQEKILKQVRALAKDDDSKVEQLNLLRQRELLRLVDSVVRVSVEEISNTYGLDPEELLEVFQMNLIQEARNSDLERL